MMPLSSAKEKELTNTDKVMEKRYCFMENSFLNVHEMKLTKKVTIYFFLYKGTVEQGSPYIILFATGCNKFVIST